MKIYAVGGAIRDALLGLPVHDIDYVVVGSSPAEMSALGYRPVGSEFPVFLHPTTQAEYALARTERKTGRGYQGFTFHAEPDVSLEEDLGRRDLTINAMAQALDSAGQLSGPIIDPYGGQADLAARILRHVSPAFAEDPLRLLRLARFAAALPSFAIAPETMQVAQTIVRSGELQDLSAERVWQEISRGFGSTQPLRMLEVFQATGAAAILLAHGTEEQLADVQAAKALAIALNLISLSEDKAADVCAVVLSNLSAADITQWAEHVRMPHRIRDYAILFSALRNLVLAGPLSAHGVMTWFNRADVWRKPERTHALLHLLQQLNYLTEPLRLALEAAQAVDAAQIAQANTRLQDLNTQSVGAQNNPGEAIRIAIEAARLKAIEPYC
ncbi:polynucleotide adenylyltransferase [Polynucleobacter sp. IMCC 30228]|uniref:polynucleotide adenylyltransferase n=1 Tax=Polynucleobacter sp. IMCC 30228 TaxID=2781011 RepID=UPI001F1E029B|nr:polynucleotide adenylyltransferase [Polynucleobacter sp. IMCC 30228]